MLRTANEDIRSLKELTMYGLKGMAAYYEHAARLGYKDTEIIHFMCDALALISNPAAEQEELYNVGLETGKLGV